MAIVKAASLKRTGVRATLLATAIMAALGAGTADRDENEAKLSSAFGAYLAGRFAVQSRDLGVAAAEFERALRDDPGIPELSNQAFLAALLSGQPLASRLAAGLPDNPLAQLTLADQDGKAGRWREAEGRYAALPQQQALTQVLRPLLIAWAQQAQGHTDEALTTLAPLVAGTRFKGVYALHAAVIADLAGKPEEAARLYRVAAADYGSVNLRLGLILASWKARHGEVQEAQQTIDELTAGDGDLAMARQALKANVASLAVRGPADGVAEAYLALAATLREQSAESALVMLRLALDMRPGLTAARILLADIDEAAKQPEAALATLSAVADDDPLAPIVALRRGAVLAERGQLEAADQVFDRLAREHPDRPEPLAQKGDMLRRRDRFTEAAAAYSAAIDRLGTPSRSSWPLFYARGIALERAGDWVRAEPDLRYALELAPDQPSILNYLAYSWAERGEHLDEARSMLERAVAARPNEGAIIDSLGWVMLRQGDAAAAIKQLDRAVELQPEDSVINGHLGDALAAAGRLREAEFQWRRALNLKPDEQDAKKLNEKLAALPDFGVVPATAPANPPPP